MASTSKDDIPTPFLGLALLLAFAATLLAIGGYVVATMRNRHHESIGWNTFMGSHVLRASGNEPMPTLIDGRAWNEVVARGDPCLLMEHDRLGNTVSGDDYPSFERWAIVYPPPAMALWGAWLTGLGTFALAISLGFSGRAEPRTTIVCVAIGTTMMAAAGLCSTLFILEATNMKQADARAAILLDNQIVRTEVWNALVETDTVRLPTLPLAPDARAQRIAIVRSALTTSGIGWAGPSKVALCLQLGTVGVVGFATLLITRASPCEA